MNTRLRSRRLSAILLTMSVTLISVASSAGADEFDWRAFPGDTSRGLSAGNYVTPVRNQGSAGTCWAFAAVAAVEANWAITNHQTNPTLDLSEQHLVCAGVEQGFGDIVGGYEYYALDWIRDHGITTEAKVPYTATNTSPNWPLTGSYDLYRITADCSPLSNSTPASIKAALLADGPLMAELMSTTDFIWPAGRRSYSSGSGSAGPSITDSAGSVLDSVGVGSEASVDSLAGVSGPVGGIDHAILITGYTDDDAVAGGGYWHVKNSWGATSGQDGNGYYYVSYQTMTLADHTFTAITGTTYVVAAPEPASLLLLTLSLATLLRRRRGAA